RRLRTAPDGGFALRAPAVVDGLYPGTRDLIFATSMTVVRVLGHDFSAHVLDVGPKVETYAGVAATPDGRTLWLTSWEGPPHLRGLTAAEGDWIAGSATAGRALDPRPWTPIAQIAGTTGSWVRPRLGQLDGDPAPDVVVTIIDRERLIAIDAESGECRWSRGVSSSGTRARRGPSLVDLDGDGDHEVLTAAPPGALEEGDSCVELGATTVPESAPDLVPESGPLDLLALEAADGRIRWRVAGAGSTTSPPVEVADDHGRWLVSASPERGLFAVSLDGALRWRAPDAADIGTPIAVGDINGDDHPDVIYGTTTGTLRVHDAATGALRWSWSPPTPTPQEAPPVLADLDGDGPQEILLATGEGLLFALDGMFLAR
ncbi:MAG: PQQ-binding-like beta-propeller repeat protein, partial [Myxococcales bacterium]|nr:PQQ-binding-like beta-propeller repeat protein [Myxococcales bacterium]